MKSWLGIGLGMSVAFSAAWSHGQTLDLDWGKLKTAAAEQQAAFSLLKSSAVAPVLQRLDARGAAPWLVQFNAPIRPEWKKALAEAGAEIAGYIPANALLVTAPPPALRRIAALPEVAWAGEYLPAFKKSRRLPDGDPDGTPAGSREVVVVLFQSADQSRITRELGEMGVFVSRADAQDGNGLLRGRLTPVQMEEVANWGEVEWIEPARKPQLWSAEPAAAASASAAADNPATTGYTQLIAICDTGLDASHPDFAGRVVGFSWTDAGFGTDGRGHGTLVAGLAVGSGAASEGRVRGVAGEAGLAVQAMGADMSGLPADLESVLQQAWEAGARIHLNGWGSADAGAYGVDARALDRFVWDHPEMLVVAAAGNTATDLAPADGVVDRGSVASLAAAKNVLAVGAAEGRAETARTWREAWPEDFAVAPIALDPVAQSNGPQGLAAFSGRGPCADGRIKPDLVAPGTQLISTRSAQAAGTAWGLAENTNYLYAGGTSLAAAQAAGAAALARQWLAEKRGLPAPSAALVKALLISGARDLAPGQYGTDAKQEIPSLRPNPAEGFGLLDAQRLVPSGDGETIALHDETGLATGEFREYPVDGAAHPGRYVAVLAYADYGASLAAGSKQVNNLDLTVQTPTGAVLHANGGGAPDSRNNVEMIEFTADEQGIYRARIEARTVPMGGSQPYALIIRGPRTDAATAVQEQP